jgi:hypothetical protein
VEASKPDRREGRGARFGLAAFALAIAILLDSCHLRQGENFPSPWPSGALGVVTQSAADRAVRGLCEIDTTLANDPHEANAVFYDRTHQELHVIAAAAEVRDRKVAGNLLLAKEKVEADLRSPVKPTTFREDVSALLTATRDALHAMRLTSPTCGPPTGTSSFP